VVPVSAAIFAQVDPETNGERLLTFRESTSVNISKAVAWLVCFEGVHREVADFIVIGLYWTVGAPLQGHQNDRFIPEE
jgi:hypothetical protein